MDDWLGSRKHLIQYALSFLSLFAILQQMSGNNALELEHCESPDRWSFLLDRGLSARCCHRAGEPHLCPTDCAAGTLPDRPGHL